MIEYLINFIDSVYAINSFVSVPIFILVHIIFAIFCVPCSPLTILAGTLWGPLGVFIGLCGSIASSSSTFFISRYVLHSFFEKKFKDTTIYIWLIKNIDKNSMKLIAFTQMNPIFPSSTLGYIYGLSSIHFRNYILYTCIFSMPLVLSLGLFGTSFRDILLNNYENLMIGLMIAFLTALFLFLLKRYIKNNWNIEFEEK